jgi:predicted nucleic acid-binding protein
VIVVADASPLRYLVLIECSEVLPQLYGGVFVPPAVITELRQEHTPLIVQAWMSGIPSWLHVQSPTRTVTPLNATLGPGELAAIALAEELAADALLMDDRDGRAEAEGRGLAVVGTLRVLADAATHGFVDFASAVDRLRHTNFRASEQLIQLLLERSRRRL